MDISRRDLFKGAAVAGVAAATTAAGFSIKPAFADIPTTPAESGKTLAENPYLNIFDGEVNYLPVKKIDKDWQYLQGDAAFEDREIPEAEIMKTDSCDFLVIGAGICGIMATLKASDEGANVICVEKMSRGRNTWESIGGYGSKAQAESGNVVDPARFADAILRSGYFRALPDVVWSYINNSGETIDYMQEIFDQSDYDIEIYNTTQPETGYDMVTIQAEHKFKITGPVEWNAHLTGMFPMAALTSVAASRSNVDLRHYTAGVQLIQDDSGRVTGAIVKNEEGYYRINASKGVLLATGGYENNFELMKAWMRPEDFSTASLTGPCSGPTGDGHMMGLRVGANMDPIPHAPMVFNGGFHKTGGRSLSIKSKIMAVAPIVNKRGVRFCNESHQKDCLANAINAQLYFTGGAWYIFDSIVMNGVDEAALKKYFEAEFLYKADTLDQLAETLGLPEGVLPDTIDQWNGYLAMDTPIDPEFRRDLVSINSVVAALTDGKVQAAALPVKEGPFYAMTTRADLLVTVSGLIVNENCQVLDTDGNVIEGLYAGGNTSGGMYSGTYPRHLPSVSVGRAATFGYVAAKHAVKGE